MSDNSNALNVFQFFVPVSTHICQASHLAAALDYRINMTFLETPLQVH